MDQIDQNNNKEDKPVRINDPVNEKMTAKEIFQIGNLLLNDSLFSNKMFNGKRKKFQRTWIFDPETGEIMIWIEYSIRRDSISCIY